MAQVVHTVLRENRHIRVLKPAAKMTTVLVLQNEAMDKFCRDEFIYFFFQKNQGHSQDREIELTMSIQMIKYRVPGEAN